MVDLTFRTLGAWGAGKGANLNASEVDNNFWSLAQAIFDLQNDPAVPNGISSIAVSGTQMTITLTDGTVLGPFTLPVLTFRWRGEWTPSTAYAVLDVIKVTEVGIFMTQIAHTSGATFDPNLQIGGLPAFLTLFGIADSSSATAADSTLVSNISGAVAPAVPNTFNAFLDHVLGTATRGTLLFRGASGWRGLAPGIAGQILATGGTTGDPHWVNAGGGASGAAVGFAAGVGGASAMAPGGMMPAIDGFNSQSTAFNPGTSSVSVALTTTTPGDKIVVIGSYCCNGAGGACAGVTLTAMCGSPTVSFTQRTSHRRVSGDIVEQYYTFIGTAAAALSAENITVTFSGSIGTSNSQANIVAFGVKNAAGFDANVSLPSAQDIAALGNATAAISTTAAHTFVFTYALNWNGFAPPGLDTGFTQLSLTGFGGFSGLKVEYRVYTTAQTGVVLTWGNSHPAQQVWVNGIDALAAV